MKDKLKRKSNDESNKMLRDPSEIHKKTIQTLKKKYGFTSKQVVSDYSIPSDLESLRADIALFSKNDFHNPKIIGEVKIGNFVLPYGEYQLEQYLITSNAKYGFLTNGVEWINYQLINGKLIQIGDIPNSKEIEKGDIEKVLKNPVPPIHLDYGLQKISQSLWESGLSAEAASLQILTFKLYDELFEKGKNFEQIIQNPENGSKIIENLWNKVNEKYSQLFYQNYFKDISPTNLQSIVLQVANISLVKSDPFSISKYLLRNFLGFNPKMINSFGIPYDLIEFICELLEITENDDVVIPFSGPETLVHTLKALYSKDPKITTKNPKIITIEPDSGKTDFLNVISLLNLPKFSVFGDDPVFSTILSEFKKAKFVISVPPFGGKISNKIRDLDDYGKDEINYFLKRLISSFDVGTKIAVVVPQKFLFTQSSSSIKIRDEILQQSTLKGIFQLPSNLFYPFSGIQTSLIILEVGSIEKIPDVFMSVIPKNDSSRIKINQELSSEIIKQFHIFSRKLTLKTHSQNAFFVSPKLLQENSWTVADKIPELKQLLDVSYKTRLLDVVSVFRGTSILGETSERGKDIPFIRISDLEGGLIKPNIKKIIKIEEGLLPKFQRSIVKKGDVLLSCRGTLGKAAIVGTHHDGNLASSQIMILRTNSDIMPEYLVTVLNTEFVQKQIAGIARGVSQPYFTTRELENIIISVPPLKQQQKIVSEFLKLEKEITDLEKILTEKRTQLGRLVKK